MGIVNKHSHRVYIRNRKAFSEIVTEYTLREQSAGENRYPRERRIIVIISDAKTTTTTTTTNWGSKTAYLCRSFPS